MKKLPKKLLNKHNYSRVQRHLKGKKHFWLDLEVYNLMVKYVKPPLRQFIQLAILEKIKSLKNK